MTAASCYVAAAAAEVTTQRFETGAGAAWQRIHAETREISHIPSDRPPHTVSTNMP